MMFELDFDHLLAREVPVQVGLQALEEVALLAADLFVLLQVSFKGVARRNSCYKTIESVIEVLLGFFGSAETRILTSLRFDTFLFFL